MFGPLVHPVNFLKISSIFPDDIFENTQSTTNSIQNIKSMFLFLAHTHTHTYKYTHINTHNRYGGYQGTAIIVCVQTTSGGPEKRYGTNGDRYT